MRYTDAGQHTTKTADITTSPSSRPDMGLEAELASFATLLPPSPTSTIPGQLDILQLLEPTKSNDPKEHQ